MRKRTGVLCCSLAIAILLIAGAGLAQAETQEKKITFSETFDTAIGSVNFSCSVYAELQVPSEVEAGSSATGTLSITPGPASISFTFSYGGIEYPVSLPYFETPLGDMDVKVASLGIGDVVVRFSTDVGASLGGSVPIAGSNMLMFSGSSSKTFEFTAPDRPGDFEISTSYQYEGSFSIVLSTFLGEYEILPSYTIGYMKSPDTLVVPVKVSPSKSLLVGTGIAVLIPSLAAYAVLPVRRVCRAAGAILTAIVLGFLIYSEPLRSPGDVVSATFILLLFVGIVFLPIRIAILRRRRKALEKPAPKVIEKVLVVCPKCDKRVSAESKFCPECGAKLGS